MNNWNIFTRNWYIVGQHAGVDLRASITVSCKTCRQIYDSEADPNESSTANQGFNISAWSHQLPDGRWAISCGYGSDFDFSEFWYLKNFPTQPVEGICDWCIRRMLKEGTIMHSGKGIAVKFMEMTCELLQKKLNV